MVKRKNKKLAEDDQDLELEDIHAWGNRKDNFYQDGQNENSSLEEEEMEAERINEGQWQGIADQDQIFEIPGEEEIELQSLEQQDQKGLSQEYLLGEIQKIVQLGQSLQGYVGKAKQVLSSYIPVYLASLISLKQMKIPYIEYHPIIEKSLQMKQQIKKLKKVMEKETENSLLENEQIDQQEEEIIEEDQQSIDYNDKGLQLYEQTKQKQQQIKQQMKKQRHDEKISNKKPTFLRVEENQFRLASEKILTNRGLMKKRKKEDSNSRVKLRRKFQKAKSKHAAKGHGIRQNPGREYDGQRNLKQGRFAGVKLK